MLKTIGGNNTNNTLNWIDRSTFSSKKSS